MIETPVGTFSDQDRSGHEPKVFEPRSPPGWFAQASQSSSSVPPKRHTVPRTYPHATIMLDLTISLPCGFRPGFASPGTPSVPHSPSAHSSHLSILNLNLIRNPHFCIYRRPMNTSASRKRSPLQPQLDLPPFRPQTPHWNSPARCNRTHLYFFHNYR